MLSVAVHRQRASKPGVSRDDGELNGFPDKIGLWYEESQTWSSQTRYHGQLKRSVATAPHLHAAQRGQRCSSL